jgi:kynurenine formamidase
MAEYKLYDLTHPFSMHAVPFMGYPSPTVQYIKRQSSDGIFAQQVTTALHVGTHIDAPLHWLGPGAHDMASIPLERLYGPAAVADISDITHDWYVYTPKDITDRVDVKSRDILIIKTGYYKYYDTDEARYMCKHPGPTKEFAKWCLKMKLRWLGVDCSSADHPMNTTAIPLYRPQLAKEFEQKIGKKLEQVFPRAEVHPMHALLFPHDLIHAENVGGDIGKLKSMRCRVGAFPWRFVGGEASICRIVAFVE